ncbi:DNA cytosine methyltransferase [Paenibacillus sp. Marseille-Q4541]|uniref:DNA cytosine methyltransferase n=1 Tax=Paenibacillus sp. Marseille-Q4541 TaxID=2831522 RepID=UPI0024B5D18D|nr:DNA cytosine methyltransferase [Paenibacillus sp. Marseille-Q4541]
MVGIKVLSLFDGMSCGQIALNRAGFKVDKYYASEINNHSIFITQKNYPNTIQLGNVEDLNYDSLMDIGQIDLLLGGSPCQNLSISNIDRKEHSNGLDGEKSKLFYEYVRVKNTVKPKYFLLENVESMSDVDKDIITEILEVEPIMIDSADFSAQDRKRYYWTNIPITNINKNKNNLFIKNIIEPSVNEKYYYSQTFDPVDSSKKIITRLHVNTHDLSKRVYNLDKKCATLTACRGGYRQKKIYLPDENRIRKLTPLEYERLQTVPEGYTEGVADSHRYNMLGDGWTVDVIAYILSHMKGFEYQTELESKYIATLNT